VVACMAHSLEEARQHADARLIVLGYKTAGRQLVAMASCCRRTGLAHRSFEAQNQYVVVTDGEEERWSFDFFHCHLVAASVPARTAREWQRKFVVRVVGGAVVLLQQVEVTCSDGCCL
jgi:hypothetical protein